MAIDDRAKEILESLVARIDMDDYVARVLSGRTAGLAAAEAVS